MNFLLSISPDQYDESIIKTEGFLETLGFGGQMLVLGVGTVFAVLVLLWLALTFFKFFFSGVKAPKETKAPTVEEAAPAVVYETQDEEIVAVIAAAIAAAESESDGVKFRVVSFRRK